MTTTPNLRVQPTTYQPALLPPDLPDAACESGLETVPLALEPHLPQWQPGIPQRYLEMPAKELRERITTARRTLGERLLILGHHYQRDDVIDFTDVRGDSFLLARQAAERQDAEFIVFCGVHFMAESADILTTPEQAVLLPNLAAGCSMSDMAQPDDVYSAWDDLTEVVPASSVVPVTYMNSAAALKAFVGRNGGAVCTSSNADAVLRWAFDRGETVFFFPDQHLGRNTAKKLGIDVQRETAVWNPRKPLGGLTPDRIVESKVLLWQGHCSVHIRFNVGQIHKARADHPDCHVVVHPECTEAVVDAADANGSTEFIIRYVKNGPPGVYAVGTEINLVHRLQTEVRAEGKAVFCLDPVICPCATMYRIHPAYLAWVTEALLEGRVVNRIQVDEGTRTLGDRRSGAHARDHIERRQRVQHADVDFLVLGSGIAGLYAALLAAQQGSTCVLTKGPIEESNTKYAQGGIAAAVGPGDSTALHFEDTLTAGAGLCDREAVAIMVREAPDRIGRLTALGVPFDAQNGAVALGREGAHSADRILHSGGDRTGNAIETVMVERIQAAGITVLDHHLATELLVEDGRVCGVQARDPQGPTVTVRSRWTVLATGGAGRLYTLTTNPAVATGDGMALAYRAGAALRDLEFVQFHPTALRIPGAPPFLISEALRGEGAILLRPDGTRFMPNYDARADLAPRDVVARAVASEMAAAGSDHVLLDISHRDGAFVASRFPGIYQFCRQYELDLTRDPLPVAPAAHYFMGGVLTDTWGRTTLPGLLACGEVASSGVHGANRLASNSLLETVVFAQRAIETAMAGAEAVHVPPETQSLDIDLDVAAPDQESLQRLLWEHAGIVRDAAGLRAASGVLDGWKPAPATADATPGMRNIALLGRLIVEAALQRRESRGAHYRADFPETQDAWQRHLTFRRATAGTH